MGESRGNQHYRIKKMFIYPEKRAKSVSVQELTLLEGEGICGDVHADGSDRQISLLTEEMEKWMEEQETEGFCFHKYTENILLEAVENDRSHEYKKAKVSPGTLLEMGEAVLELTESLKTCHPDRCALAKTGKTCLLAGEHSFAKVKKGGIVKIGMPVNVVRK